MTVLSSDSTKRFHGSGSTGPFTWPWRFLANEDILAYRIATPNEAQPWAEARTLMVEGSDYYLTGAGTYTGGSLTLVSALANGEDLYVERVTEALQTVSIRNQGANFRPEVHENVFDRLMMCIQDRERRIAELEAVPTTVDLSTVSGGGTATILEVDTSTGPYEVQLPASGELVVVKRGVDADEVTFAATVGGQTVNADSTGTEIPFSLTGDGQSVRLVLIGTNWTIIG